MSASPPPTPPPTDNPSVPGSQQGADRSNARTASDAQSLSAAARSSDPAQSITSAYNSMLNSSAPPGSTRAPTNNTAVTDHEFGTVVEDVTRRAAQGGQGSQGGQ
ncbi:hypothetical protein IAT40_007563 [Kwoniella sp. CBS 6097]